MKESKLSAATPPPAPAFDGDGGNEMSQLLSHRQELASAYSQLEEQRIFWEARQTELRVLSQSIRTAGRAGSPEGRRAEAIARQAAQSLATLVSSRALLVETGQWLNAQIASRTGRAANALAQVRDGDPPGA